MIYPGSLHNHTDYSNLTLRDSTNTVNSLLARAKDLNYTTVGFTEHETIANAIKIENAAANYPDIKVIRGNEIYLVRNDLTKETYESGKDRYWHFLLLAKDIEGHKQIRELSTRAWMRSWKQGKMRRRPTYYSDLEEIVGANPGHVIGSTACLGGVIPAQYLLYLKNGRDKDLLSAITSKIKYFSQLFGKDHFYLELQPSAEEKNDQWYVNQGLLELSNELNVPAILTLDAHYLSKEDAPIHKAFLNAQDGEREVDSFYATTYLMDDKEIQGYIGDYISQEQIQTMYDNITKISDMCENYTLKKPLKIPSLKWKEPTVTTIDKKWFERIPYLKTFVNSPFDGDSRLAHIIVSRLESTPSLCYDRSYKEIDQNLEMIWVSSEVNKAHWSAYLLNLQNVIDICWDAGSLVGCSRGSGGGFYLLYILDIIQLDKLRETTELFPWRFLNPSRVSPLDIDVDISGLKRGQVLEALRKAYGYDKVAGVATFRTEKSKSAILTAARGMGIDVDEAQYLASMIPSDRGILRSLKQCYYGDEENDFKPIPEFVKAMKGDYNDLWQVAQKIEGLICGLGVHAGGIIFVDEPFTESTALMRAPDDTIITQFELHDSEEASLIKYDLLSVEALDKIQITLDLLCDYGYVDREPTLRETYEKTIGVYNLERKNPKMWDMVNKHKIQSLFQLEAQSGIQGILLTKPCSVDDLASLNSAIRLMAQEKGGEQPLDKYARFKNDITLWYKEMDAHGLTKAEQEILKKELSISYGLCITQEQFMKLVQIPECGGFDLDFADRLRKSIAKKNPKDYAKLEIEYFKTVEEKGLSKNLCNYVWKTLIAMNKGYGFNALLWRTQA